MPDRKTQTIRAAIVAAMQAQHVSQYALARLSGLSQGRIWEYVHGRCDLRGANLDRLLVALGLRIMDASCQHDWRDCTTMADWAIPQVRRMCILCEKMEVNPPTRDDFDRFSAHKTAPGERHSPGGSTPKPTVAPCGLLPPE